MADPVGFLVGAMFMLPFLPSLFPVPSEHHATISYGVGLSNSSAPDDDIKKGAPFPKVALFDINGNFLGADPGGYFLHEGTSPSLQNALKVEMSYDGQPAYMAISAGPSMDRDADAWDTDSICLAYVALTLPDASKFLWVGDWGAKCGANWYPSALDLGDGSGMTYL
jgi:hypothetical protein